MSLDNLRIVEGRNEGLAFLATRLLGCLVGVVESIARKNNLHELATKHLHLIDFLLGGSYGHKNLTIYAELVARERHALRVITRAGAYDATLRLLLGERANLVISTANLI